MSTVSYIARPLNSRCRWWSKILPENLNLEAEQITGAYLTAGADLELHFGEMIIDSEQNHPRKPRGYTTMLGVAFRDEVLWIKPTLNRKKYIKEHGGQDLMVGSGDVKGVVRMAIWLRRQIDLIEAFKALQEAGLSGEADMESENCADIHTDLIGE